MSTGTITLSTHWTKYTLDVSHRDLSYVLGGFDWAAGASSNANDITFYVDDIQFDQARPDSLRLLASYRTTDPMNDAAAQADFDQVIRNVAFTYDNAVACLAFLAAGDIPRARMIGDALVYVQAHDRFYTDGRIRNAYQAGDLVMPGWTPNGKIGTARMPGWSDAQGKWQEDQYDVSTDVGNCAWCMLALIGCYEMTREPRYLLAAEWLGDWVDSNCRDDRVTGGYHGGYMAGFTGWEPIPGKPGTTPETYKATEHNIDLYAGFERIYRLTHDLKWRRRSQHALMFVRSMWDSKEGKFWTGTNNDGKTVEVSGEHYVVPVDI